MQGRTVMAAGSSRRAALTLVEPGARRQRRRHPGTGPFGGVPGLVLELLEASKIHV